MRKGNINPNSTGGQHISEPKLTEREKLSGYARSMLLAMHPYKAADVTSTEYMQFNIDDAAELVRAGLAYPTVVYLTPAGRKLAETLRKERDE